MSKVIDRPQNLELVSSEHPFKEYCREFIKIHFYQLSQREIARNLKIGKTTVNRWAKFLGLVFKKHTVDEDYFDHWSSKMAYILGYICADGNIAWDTQRGYQSLTITASMKDKAHLERIRKILKSSKTLLYSPSTKSYRLIVNNRKICLRLMNLGIFPKKSLILKFPKVPKKYIKDFVRGYIDGDGSLKYFARKRSPYFEIMICSGSKSFIMTLNDKIYQNLAIKSKIFQAGANCYILRYCCSRGRKLAEWMYNQSEIYLIRKFSQYEKALCPRKE